MIHPAFWPVLSAAVASQTTAAWFASLARSLEAPAPADDQPPAWTTPNTVALDLQTMALRDFSASDAGTPVIVCAPFAIHRATVADLAPGHSIVESLLGAGIARLFVTDWRSATADMRYLAIDNYLSDLNVAIDSLGPPVDLAGLCQGGWLAALYAARFPHKVRRLVLVGAPIDPQAAASPIAGLASRTPAAVFRALVDAGQGLMPGHRLMDRLVPPRDGELAQLLQLPGDTVPRELRERFETWWRQTLSLPGVYYLQAVEWLFRENRIARGEFVALGRRVSLDAICCPLFLLAGADDETVAAEQLFALQRLAGTPAQDVVSVVQPGGHLSLFMGRRVLDETWSEIGRWLLRASEDLEARRDAGTGTAARPFTRHRGR